MSKKRKLAEAKKALVSVAIITAICNSTFAASSKSYTTTTVNDGKTSYVLVKNPKNGPVLGYSENSGVKLIEVTEKGYTYAFKDLNKNGKLDVFEDWRKSIDERAGDLAKKLTTEQIAGLMLFSSHERAIEEGLTDAQKKYLSEDNLRAV